MGFAPPIQYHLPAEGPHVGCLVDQIDLGPKPNRFPDRDGKPKPDRHMNRLVFLTDDDTSYPGERLYLHADVNLVRHWQGILITYIRAFNHLPAKASISPDISWEMEDYIGRCLGLNVVHNGTWANVCGLYTTNKTLAIPAGYQRKSATPVGTFNTQSSTISPSTQPKPAQSTVQAEKAVRVKDTSFETGQEKEEAYIPF